MEMQNKIPKVSICVVTYNQEKYIRQCLQSIVDQEAEFDFEVIVGDDCSRDGTREIVKEFSNRYPDLIRIVLHEKNVGPTQNYMSVHNLALGQLVAHVDGDDYCLPGKLKVMASFLDSNQGCVIVWHRMYILNEKNQFAVGMPIVPMKKFFPSEKLFDKELAQYYGITGCHSGSMYRLSAKTIVCRNIETLDYFFTLSFCMNGGYAAYIDEPLGVYRFFSHEKTVTRSKGSVITGCAKLDLIQEYLQKRPDLAKSFATQCLFELLLRTYLRYPLKFEYLKMLFVCRCMPSLPNLLRLMRIFMANRNSKLRVEFEREKILQVNT